jgi:hypothetical protein
MEPMRLQDRRPLDVPSNKNLAQWANQPRNAISGASLIPFARAAMNPQEMFEKIRQLQKENDYLQRQREILSLVQSSANSRI